MEIIAVTINLEHIGDIVDRNLSELAAKKIKRGSHFSPDGQAEIAAFHKRVMESLHLSLGVSMGGDVDGARNLLREKAELKSIELAASERHVGRLREGRPETLETTTIHLDVVHDLWRIHSHICAAAYPLLSAEASHGQG
jgi:phosphate:Na+ symporter